MLRAVAEDGDATKSVPALEVGNVTAAMMLQASADLRARTLLEERWVQRDSVEQESVARLDHAQARDCELN